MTRSTFSREDVRSGLLIAASIGMALYVFAQAGMHVMSYLVAPFLSIQ